MCWRNFCNFPWWLKNVKSRSKIVLFSNERHFEIWFPKKKTITFFWWKFSKLHKKDPILHVATTFSLKQGETRTSHGPIPHPLIQYFCTCTRMHNYSTILCFSGVCVFFRCTVQIGAANLIFASYIKMQFLKCVQSKLYFSKKATFMLLPQCRGDINGRQLRNNAKLTQPRARTNRYACSQIPYHVELINSKLP